MRELISRLTRDEALPWAPIEHELTVLLLNTAKARTKGGAPVNVTWAEVAARARVSQQELMSDYPNVAKFVTPDVRRELRIDALPEEGVLDIAARRLLRDVLGSPTGGGCVGFYLANGAYPEGVEIRTTVRISHHVEYGIGRVDDLRAFLEAWAAADVRNRWQHHVSHVWPESQEWFVLIDPDSAFAAVSCDQDRAVQLLASTEVECWIGSPQGPRGEHRLPPVSS